MGQSGTDVARESADLVLLDDHFDSIVAGIEQGRATYVNMRDNMDLDTSAVLVGKETIGHAGRRVFEEIVAVASGKLTRAERLGQRDFTIFQINPS